MSQLPQSTEQEFERAIGILSKITSRSPEEIKLHLEKFLAEYKYSLKNFSYRRSKLSDYSRRDRIFKKIERTIIYCTRSCVQP